MRCLAITPQVNHTFVRENAPLVYDNQILLVHAGAEDVRPLMRVLGEEHRGRTPRPKEGEIVKPV